MHELRFLLRAVGGGERVLLRLTALKGVLPAGLVVDGVIQPQQVVPIGADVPRLLGQQSAGVLVQPAGDGLVRLLRAHGHAVGGREVPIRQRVHGLLLHVGVLPQERAVGQTAHRPPVVQIHAHPQVAHRLPQGLAVGRAQQCHHLPLRLSVGHLRQHAERRIQTDGRIHPVLAVGEELVQRPVRKGHQRVAVRLRIQLAQLLQRLPVLGVRRVVGVPVALTVFIEVVFKPRLFGIGWVRRLPDNILRQIHGSSPSPFVVRLGLHGAARQHQPGQHRAHGRFQSFHGKYLLFFLLHL